MAAGHTAQQTRILDALAAHEAVPDARSFIRNDEWLVGRDYLARLPLHLLPGYGEKIPGLYRTSLFGLFGKAARAGADRRTIGSRAQILQMKASGERLRAFYLGPGERHCLKIVSRAYANYAGCKREVDLRQELARIGTITLPPVEAVSEDSAYLYCRERLVLGRRFSPRLDHGLFAQAVLPQLLATYRAWGIESKAIGEALPADLETTLASALADHPEHTSFRDRVTRILESDRTVAVGLCHGDLLPSNLAVSGRKVHFLDWERAGEGVIAFDLLRMARKYPGKRFFARQARAAIESLGPADGLDFQDLLAAYVALSIAQHPERVARYMSFYRAASA